MSQSSLVRFLTMFPTYLPKPVREALFNSPLRSMARGGYRRLLNQTDVTEVVTLQSPLAGYRMRVSLAVGKGLIYGTYEPALCKAIQQHVKPGFVCLDIGANIGYFTLLLAHYAGQAGRVYAFEPLPQNHEVLNENVALNQLGMQVQPIALALSNKAGTAEFMYRSDVFTGGGSLVTADPWGDPSTTRLLSTEVKIITGDSFFEAQKDTPHVDFIKLDVEGAEGLVLEGLQNTIARNYPIILMEKHTCDGSTAEHALAILKDWSYSLTWLDDMHVLAQRLEG